MKYRKTYGILAALTIILTLILCGLFIRDWHGITAMALFFMVLSEGVLFGGLIFLDAIAEKTSQIIARVGIGTVIITYSFLTFISSLVFMTVLKEAVKGFIAVEAVLLIVGMMAGIIFYTVSKAMKR